MLKHVLSFVSCKSNTDKCEICADLTAQLTLFQDGFCQNTKITGNNGRMQNNEIFRTEMRAVDRKQIIYLEWPNIVSLARALVHCMV